MEAAFDTALRSQQREPVERLVKVIQAADHFLGNTEANAEDSPYKAMIRKFSAAPYLTFNYDSLLEQILLKNQAWSPADGFGVSVEVTWMAEPPCRNSTSLVVHLHGSVLLYPVDYSLTPSLIGGRQCDMLQLTEPKFVFDPDNLGPRFQSVRRPPPGAGYQHPHERVIVPVPTKTGRESSYTQAAYAKAKELTAEATLVIAIGYAFAECDKASFAPLIHWLSRKDLCIVAPDAVQTAERLRRTFPGLRVVPKALTLSKWAESGFAI